MRRPAALVCLLLLVFVSTTQAQTLAGFDPQAAALQRAFEQKVAEWSKSDRFKEHLTRLTSEPHIAGTPESGKVIEYMAQAMAAAGLKVERHPYDVLLPKSVRNEVWLVSPVEMALNNKETVHEEDPYSADPRLFEGWNAYSGSGEATAPVVYVNRGTKEDFEELRRLGVDLRGKIAIARYGGNFRGYKAKYAEEAGMVGLVIYTDPAAGSYEAGMVYPQGRNVDETTIQRGSLLTLNYTGDPLTPFEPALPVDAEGSPQRLDPGEVAFHSIPVLPLPYGSAKEILSRLGGDEVPENWKGGLPLTYRMGGTDDVKVRIHVEQPYEMTRIENVVGILEGTKYPDEFILLGCHHDAWSFGSTDPNSGTAMLLMMADMLGELAAQGFRPERSIKIAHWDAEEFFIIGSSEYVEQFRDDLAKNGMAYLNADMAVTGANFGSSSAPSLKRLIVESAKAIPYSRSEGTVFDHWAKEEAWPRIGNLGGGSDHVGFYTHAGVPSASVGVSGSVPVYHSNYDNLHWYDKFASDGYTYGLDLAKVLTVVTTRLANAAVTPYDAAQYHTDLEAHVSQLRQMAGNLELSADWRPLETALGTLREAVADWEPWMHKAAEALKDQPEKLADINAQLRTLEQAFISDEGLRYSRWQRSLYASPDPYSGYASWMLPGIRYEIEERNRGGLQTEITRMAKAVDALSGKIQAIKATVK